MELKKKKFDPIHVNDKHGKSSAAITREAAKAVVGIANTYFEENPTETGMPQPVMCQQVNAKKDDILVFDMFFSKNDESLKDFKPEEPADNKGVEKTLKAISFDKVLYDTILEEYFTSNGASYEKAYTTLSSDNAIVSISGMCGVILFPKSRELGVDMGEIDNLEPVDMTTLK